MTASSIRGIAGTVLKLINTGELNEALHLIYDVVERIFTEPLCVSQVYGSRTLDDLCQQIGKESFASLHFSHETQCITSQRRPIFVYVVTRLQKSGGHSRVIEDFIRAQPSAEHIVLSTELCGRSSPEHLTEALQEHISLTIEYVPKGNFLQRLVWLQQRLMEIKPTRVYLFNHHQDSIAVAAIQPEMQFNASFYHHGDHHLCLGVYLTHLEHIDPHPMGYHYCRDVLGIENIYIPLTIEDKGERDPRLEFVNGGTLTTCTVARSNKVEVPYFISYLELVPRLLKVTGGRHIHIGRLTPWALFKLHSGLKKYDIHSERFQYVSWVPSVWEALREYNIDLYIASFPYGGGLTLIEAMGAGVPVAMHKHLYSRVLSGIDLAYPGAFSWRYPDDLLEYCEAIRPSLLERDGHAARQQYVSFHANTILERILNSKERIGPTPEPLNDEFTVASDEWALWVEQQLSFKSVIGRVAYRTFRHLRRIF